MEIYYAYVPTFKGSNGISVISTWLKTAFKFRFTFRTGGTSCLQTKDKIMCNKSLPWCVSGCQAFSTFWSSSLSMRQPSILGQRIGFVKSSACETLHSNNYTCVGHRRGQSPICQSISTIQLMTAELYFRHLFFFMITRRGPPKGTSSVELPFHSYFVL